MSAEAQNPAKPPRARKPAKNPAGQARPRAKAKDATADEVIASPRVPVSVVPEIPAATQGAATRRASPLRLGLLTTTLTLFVGYLAWFNDTPELSHAEPAPAALGIAYAPFGSDDPLPQHARQGMEQEFRLATMALEIRESQENLARLWDDARSLASSMGSLASGIESLKSDVGAVRQDAVAALTRVEERLHHVEVASASELIPLGVPALRETNRLGYAEFADSKPSIVQASAAVQPDTTGALPEVPEVKASQASVKVSFAKPKPRIRSPKPIDGWLVHNVRDDLALVESQGAHYEVRAGELLPDAGIVRAIKKRGDKWVVVTNKGVITEAK